MKAESPEARDIVGGKYELVSVLGCGSMGQVWLAVHQTLHEQVALKLLSRPSWVDAEHAGKAAARFRFEAQIAARLSRKTRYIARVTDHGEERDRAYLVMELLEGMTLHTRLMQRDRMPPADVLVLVKHVSRALEHAHAEGVLHRDLKPSNVFMTKDEDGHTLFKVLDFGIARAIHAHLVPVNFSTAKGVVFGTPGYMSPEQARATATLDHRCDLWALATLAYESLTGELPVDGFEPDELMKNVCAGRIVPMRKRDANAPAALEAFFSRAFSEHIEERYQSAYDLSVAFEHAVSGVARPQEVEAFEMRKAARDAQTMPPAERERVSSWQVVHSRHGAPNSSHDGSSPNLRPGPRPARLIATLAVGCLVTAAAAVAVWRSRSGQHPDATAATPAAPAAATLGASAGPTPAAPALRTTTSTTTIAATQSAPPTATAPPPTTSSTTAAATTSTRARSAMPGPIPRPVPRSQASPAAAPATPAAAASPKTTPPPKPTDKSEVL